MKSESTFPSWQDWLAGAIIVALLWWGLKW
jgi:hypothetical protein